MTKWNEHIGAGIDVAQHPTDIALGGVMTYRHELNDNLDGSEHKPLDENGSGVIAQVRGYGFSSSNERPNVGDLQHSGDGFDAMVGAYRAYRTRIENGDGNSVGVVFSAMGG